MTGERQLRVVGRTVGCVIIGIAGAWFGGCASPSGQGPWGNAPAVSNPLFVRANDGEFVWEKTVDVAHDYLFEIERENKLDGVIETRYKTGASVLEPWHGDTVGVANRLESSLQSIRRKAIFTVTPAQGGYMVGVQTIKELEDVAAAANSVGAATFLDNNPLQRDLDVVVGQATPSGWINQGHDPALEQSLLKSLSAALGR
ncbi:MAG TPA: hypothetical protein VFG20_15370 [Planctomycetaceae bacterium]|nr:hypothetical protein [Planctomycetaceae bacterium]